MIANKPSNQPVKRMIACSAGSGGLVYPSQRRQGGECVGLFYPDCASNPVQGRHLGYHWNGSRVDMYRDATTGQIYRIML